MANNENILTAAQSARVALIRSETGNRLTFRRLGAGYVKVTEYDADGKASVVMNPHGEYVA